MPCARFRDAELTRPAVAPQLLSVTAGYLLFGVAGAVIAVPLVAVVRSIVDALREDEPRDSEPRPTPAGTVSSPGEPRSTPDRPSPGTLTATAATRPVSRRDRRRPESAGRIRQSTVSDIRAAPRRSGASWMSDQCIGSAGLAWTRITDIDVEVFRR